MLYSRSMGRIIAIDYGRKRTGIAATDILQMIANGVATVPSGEVVKYLFGLHIAGTGGFICGRASEANEQ